MARWASYSLLVLLLASNCVLAQSQKELQNTLILAHRSAVQAVQSLSCQVTVQDGVGKLQQNTTGRYWRDFNAIRIHQDGADGQSQDLVVKDGELVSLSKLQDRGKLKFFAGRQSASQRLSVCDVWAVMLLNVPGPKGTRLLLDEFLERVVVACEISRDRSSSFYVKADFDDADDGKNHLELWFDASVNYLIRRMALTVDKFPRNRWEFAIGHFEEGAPGVFFPAQSTARSLYDGKVIMQSISTLSELHINESIPADQFTLVVPPGTPLADKIRGISYTTGNHGHAPGNIKPMPSATLPPMTLSGEEAYSRQTQHEPIKWGLVVLLGSLGILAAACVYWVSRKRRGAS